MTTVQVYDIEIGSVRPATQRDFDILLSAASAYSKVRAVTATTDEFTKQKLEAIEKIRREDWVNIKARTYATPAKPPAANIAQFAYRNHAGKFAERTVEVLGLRWGTTDYYPVPQWLLRGRDIEKNEEREFALAGMGVPLECQQTPAQAELALGGDDASGGSPLAHAQALVPAIAQLSAAIHQLNARWWQDPRTGAPIERNVGEMLMLMVSEIAEAMEGHRKGLPDDKLPRRSMLEVEIADTIIRALDFAGGLRLDVAGAIAEKLAYNTTRTDHTPAARLAPGGKAY